MGQPNKMKTYRVGKTKHLRYLDAYLKDGSDPQRAVFTLAMLRKFTSDCEKLSKRMYKIAENPLLEKRFPTLL